MGKNTKRDIARHDAPQFSVRKSSHGAIWSVWARIEGEPSEELFECSSEKAALNWIPTGGKAWTEARLRKRMS